MTQGQRYPFRRSIYQRDQIGEPLRGLHQPLRELSEVLQARAERDGMREIKSWRSANLDFYYPEIYTCQWLDGADLYASEEFHGAVRKLEDWLADGRAIECDP